jgi:predicted house-cleaning noncanonical NTP pyrophosphatase (MazG superfamily)
MKKLRSKLKRKIRVKELSDFYNIEDLADYLKVVKIKSETTVWHSLDNVKAELGL